MKTCSIVILTLLTVSVSVDTLGQNKKRKKQEWPVEEKHIAISEFPNDKMVNFLDGWGGMTVAVNSMPAGSDLAPLLIGLKNNSCQVPHWGYIIQGVLKLQYDDGKEVTLKAGDLFYMSPGHKAKAIEDLKLLDFSPEEEFKELVTYLEQKAAEMQKPKEP
jgi:mannose-6-phosphate isomerase-like protein (cupin superfamily)